MEIVADPRTSNKIYGGDFDENNRNNPRTIIANWVTPGSRILEVGPGNGVIGGWLRDKKGCTTTGLEIVPEAAEIAEKCFDHMIVGSIESEDIAAKVMSHGPFDAIIYADVLEHLVDPWHTLLMMRGMLANNGQLLTSFPNIAHWSARLNLLRGRFDYTEGYLMDRTHLRWFTFRSAREMAHATGYRVLQQQAVYRPRFLRFWKTLMGYQIVMQMKVA
jgi:2-polyprenyl-3-methyl-5-hydroxy-6-metoxy-1,4-benzoquinol methylase